MAKALRSFVIQAKGETFRCVAKDFGEMLEKMKSEHDIKEEDITNVSSSKGPSTFSLD